MTISITTSKIFLSRCHYSNLCWSFIMNNISETYHQQMETRTCYFFKGTFFEKYGVIGIKLLQNGKPHGIMSIHFVTRKIWNHLIHGIEKYD